MTQHTREHAKAKHSCEKIGDDPLMRGCAEACRQRFATCVGMAT